METITKQGRIFEMCTLKEIKEYIGQYLKAPIDDDIHLHIEYKNGTFWDSLDNHERFDFSLKNIRKVIECNSHTYVIYNAKIVEYDFCDFRAE